MIISSQDNELAALSDYSLLARVAHGDTSAFDALFHRHYDRVYGVLFRLVGERAEVARLAPTVAAWLGIPPPAAAEWGPLTEALEPR